MLKDLPRIVIYGALLLVAASAPAAAQATRTWVSGVGDDANPCSRTAPCKTFAGAISKTATGGVISVLDPGGFGALTITKAISLQTDPSLGGILAAGTNGIIVNAANAEIVINGLIFDGAGTGLNGIRILSARSVSLNDCLFRAFRGTGGVAVDVAPSAGLVAVTVSNCTITGNKVGVKAAPTATGTARVVLDNVIIERNTLGGIIADGGNATVAMSDSIVKDNANGLSTANGGSIRSYGNNVILQNMPDGSPSVTSPLQ